MDKQSEQDSNHQFRIKTGIKSCFGMLLGDAVAVVTHATGIDCVAACYTEITGKDCGCDKRRQFLNRWFPC
jgi:hypothetical protein